MNLLEAVRDNKTEEAIAALEAGGNPVFTKDGWNPLLWSACNGNEEIVRVLIKRDACNPYIKDTDNSATQDVKSSEKEDPAFRKPDDAKKIGKYTPLHWASYKGWAKIVWILLKEGMSPLKID
jgi:ankyrin repeat protein